MGRLGVRYKLDEKVEGVPKNFAEETLEIRRVGCFEASEGSFKGEELSTKGKMK